MKACVEGQILRLRLVEKKRAREIAELLHLPNVWVVYGVFRRHLPRTRSKAEARGDELRQLWATGAHVTTIARTLGVSRWTVQRWATELRLPPRLRHAA